MIRLRLEEIEALSKKHFTDPRFIPLISDLYYFVRDVEVKLHEINTPKEIRRDE